MRVFSADKLISVPYEDTTFEISKDVDGNWNLWAIPAKRGYLMASYPSRERAVKEMWSIARLGESKIPIIEVQSEN